MITTSDVKRSMGWKSSGSSRWMENMELLIPGLTNDAAVQCLARVPRSCFGTLRCVNRAWQSLLTSKYYFSLRKADGLTEDWLYVMFRSTDGQYRWKVFQVSQRKWLSLPPMPALQVGAVCSVVDSKLFLMGGSCAGESTRKVWFYDPITNRWNAAPPMRVPREFAAAGAIDGKIYVVGGCDSPGGWAGSVAWAEVYDPSTETWDVVPSPPERRERWTSGSAVLDGKLFARGDSGVLALDPRSNSWTSMSAILDSGWRGKAAVLKGMLFSHNHFDKIIGYHLEKDSWQALELEDKKISKLVCGIVIASVSGQLFVLGEYSRKGSMSVLALTAIEVEEGEDQRLHGRIFWSDVSPIEFRVAAFVHCLPIGL